MIYRSCQTFVVGAINKPELQYINHESNYSVMHQDFLGIANSFAAESFNASTQGEVFTFDWLCVFFANSVKIKRNITIIATQIDLSSIAFSGRSVKVIGKEDKARTPLFSAKAKYMIEEYLKIRPGGTALFCSSRQTYGRLKGRSVQQLIESIGVRASLSRHIYPHILRHAFATNCLISGMDITVIQQLLRHNDLSTTQTYA